MHAKNRKTLEKVSPPTPSAFGPGKKEKAPTSF
jgi:hypothetical protein